MNPEGFVQNLVAGLWNDGKNIRRKSESGESGNQLPLHDPDPPEPVLIFGFPSEIGFELTEQRPLGRLGIISMVAGNKFLKMEGKFGDERAWLVDIEAFPGNSGSPVINQFNRVSACGGRAFYETIWLLTFYEIINLGWRPFRRVLR